MSRGALRHPEGGRSERPLVLRLHRRAIAAWMSPANDNRPAGIDRLRRLLAPGLAAAGLLARFIRRR